MATNLRSKSRGLRDRCTPVLAEGDSSEADQTRSDQHQTSSDRTPEQGLTTSSDFEHPKPSNAGNNKISCGNGNTTLPAQSEVKKINERAPNKRLKWDKAVNCIVMECYLRSEPKKRGYRQRMKKLWDTKGVFEANEGRLADQARAIRTNSWLTDLEIEEINRKILCTENEPITGDAKHVEDREQVHIVEEVQIPDVIEIADIPAVKENVDEVLEKAAADGFNFDQETSDYVRKIMERMEKDQDDIPPNLRYVDRKQVQIVTSKVDLALKFITTTSITETNRLIQAVANVVAEAVGYKSPNSKSSKKQEPAWRRRIHSNIERLRCSISRLDRLKKGELKNARIVTKLETEFNLQRKGIETVIEELKQRLTAMSARLQRYDTRNNQYRQNMLFQSNQKKLFDEIEGISKSDDVCPDAAESQKFWSEIWDNPVHHNENAEWLGELENELVDVEQQADIRIDVKSLRTKLKKVPNWKSPGPDGVQGFWLKKLVALHVRIAAQLDQCLQTGSVPEWMTTGKTVLCLKDKEKGAIVSNFRPITCLPLMWKLLTGVLADHLYDHLDEKDLLPVEQKGCRRGSRGTKDQLLIDKAVIRNSKRRQTNLAMAWIDYKKAYDMVPHSWIEKSMNLFKVAKNVENLVSKSMNQWNTELTASGKNLGNVKIRRGIFQGDSLSPLLFVLAMIPMSLVLRKIKMSYSLGKKQESVNHLLFMDDLKLYAKSEDQIDSLIHSVRIFTDDIKMEFGLSKCAMIVIKRGKLVRSEGIKMPDGEVLKSLEDGDEYKYLGVLEADNIKHETMKNNIKKEYVRRIRKILSSKLNGGNIISSINSKSCVHHQIWGRCS